LARSCRPPGLRSRTYRARAAPHERADLVLRDRVRPPFTKRQHRVVGHVQLAEGPGAATRSAGPEDLGERVHVHERRLGSARGCLGSRADGLGDLRVGGREGPEHGVRGLQRGGGDLAVLVREPCWSGRRRLWDQGASGWCGARPPAVDTRFRSRSVGPRRLKIAFRLVPLPWKPLPRPPISSLQIGPRVAIERGQDPRRGRCPARCWPPGSCHRLFQDLTRVAGVKLDEHVLEPGGAGRSRRWASERMLSFFPVLRLDVEA